MTQFGNTGNVRVLSVAFLPARNWKDEHGFWGVASDSESKSLILDGGPRMKGFTSIPKTTWGVRCRNAMQLLGAVFALLLLCLPAYSQGNFGRILGNVTDQSGGVVSGATVTVLDTQRGLSRTLTTDDTGAYNAPTLIPGTYTVSVEANGFKKLERRNVVLQVGEEVRVDLTVEPGEQNQTITVTEAIPLV